MNNHHAPSKIVVVIRALLAGPRAGEAFRDMGGESHIPPHHRPTFSKEYC